MFFLGEKTHQLANQTNHLLEVRKSLEEICFFLKSELEAGNTVTEEIFLAENIRQICSFCRFVGYS